MTFEPIVNITVGHDKSNWIANTVTTPDLRTTLTWLDVSFLDISRCTYI